jgi:hypothetical protein
MEEILASTFEEVETSKALVNLIHTKCKGYWLDLKICLILPASLTALSQLKKVYNVS